MYAPWSVTASACRVFAVFALRHLLRSVLFFRDNTPDISSVCFAHHQSEVTISFEK
jgi:hypothetical protein